MIYNNSFPIGVKPLTVVWHFQNADHSNYSMSGYTLALTCRSSRSEQSIQGITLSGDGTSLSFNIPVAEQKFVGSYSLRLVVTNPSTNAVVCDLRFNRAFTLVPTTEENDAVYEEGDGAETINLYTVANYSMFSNVPYITAGVDGYLKSDGVTMKDAGNNPVKWWKGIEVVTTVPAVANAREGVIYRKVEGKRYTDYVKGVGDVTGLHANGGPWGGSGADFVYDGDGSVQVTPYESRIGYFWKTTSSPALRMNTLSRNPSAGDDFYYGTSRYTSVASVVQSPAMVSVESDYLKNFEQDAYDYFRDNDATMDTKADKTELAVVKGEGAKSVILNNSDNHAYGLKSTALGQTTIVGNTDKIITTETDSRKDDLDAGCGSFAVGVETLAKARASFAEGEKSKALGAYSHAEGEGTVATGKRGHAEGNYSIAGGKATRKSDGTYEDSTITGTASNCHAEGKMTFASGMQSHAEGALSEASGETSHAEGLSTLASGAKSHAEGYLTKASGNHSHSEGQETEALGVSSHAEGFSCKASAQCSHAEGSNTETTAGASHTEGYMTYAGDTTGKSHITTGEGSGSGSSSSESVDKYYGTHAEGYNTFAGNTAAHSEGYMTSALGIASHTEGVHTMTNNEAEHAEGKYNKSNTGTMHSIGIGTADTARKNAVEVMSDGKMFIKGVGGYDGTNPTTATSLQDSLTAIQEMIVSTLNTAI